MKIVARMLELLCVHFDDIQVGEACMIVKKMLEDSRAPSFVKCVLAKVKGELEHHNLMNHEDLLQELHESMHGQ